MGVKVEEGKEVADMVEAMAGEDKEAVMEVAELTEVVETEVGKVEEEMVVE